MIRYLSILAAFAAVRLLRLFGVDAVCCGPFAIVNGRRFHVAGECSGIRSLSSIVILMFFMGVVDRSGLRHTALLVVAGAAVAVACNILRLCFCMLWPLAWGWDGMHRISGYVSSTLAVGLMLWLDGRLRRWRKP